MQRLVVQMTQIAKPLTNKNYRKHVENLVTEFEIRKVNDFTNSVRKRTYLLATHSLTNQTINCAFTGV